jgi:hypothetical protein
MTNELNLIFTQVTDTKGETLTCCMCGKQEVGDNEIKFLKAEITIAVKATVAIAVCGEICKNKLLRSDTAMRNLKVGIRNARTAHRKQALKKMGRRFGVLIFFFLAVACASSKPVVTEHHRTRYKQDPGPYMPEYVMPKKAKKISATGKRKKN